VGYPKCWEDLKKKNQKTVTIFGIPQTTSNCNGDTRREEEAKPQAIHGRAPVTHGGKRRKEDTSPGKSDQWIFYCGATDTMTHDPHDFNNLSTPVKTHIETTTSGELVTVQGEGSIVLSKELKLENCLYVPVLSSKLLSISEVTKELNCVVLMFPTFCLFQDILTKEIIGHGAESGGLYYVDEVAKKRHAMLAHEKVTRQLWLWHRCLGHHSFGYLKILFRSLFTSNTEPIKCETCIRANNHRVTVRYDS